MKIEKPNEKGRRRGSRIAPQGSAGQGSISLFQAVGYLTGEMKECRSWLKGRQVPREEAARPGQGESLASGLDGESCSLSRTWQGPYIWGALALSWLQVAIMYPTTAFRIKWLSLILVLCKFFTSAWSRYRTTTLAMSESFFKQTEWSFLCSFCNCYLCAQKILASPSFPSVQGSFLLTSFFF